MLETIENCTGIWNLYHFFLDRISQALAFLLNLKIPNMPNSQKSVEQRIEGKMVI